MTWRRHYAIAQSLHERAENLFSLGEAVYAGEGIWGALRHISQAMVHRYGRVDGNSFEKGYIPGRCNSEERVDRRKRRWSAANNLHQNFYRGNLADAAVERNRTLATELLREGFERFQSRESDANARPG